MAAREETAEEGVRACRVGPAPGARAATGALEGPGQHHRLPDGPLQFWVSIIHSPHSQPGGSLALQGFGIRSTVREPQLFSYLL